MTKRDHHHHQIHAQPITPMDPKGKMATDAGDDELLAALGYKVRTSSMADVAQKLEHLEMAMSLGAADDTILSHLSTDAIHYNPSDLSSWLESMLTELNVPPLPASDQAESSVTSVDRHDDLSAIVPVGLVDPDTREKKRIRSTASSSDPVSMVLVDSQETGIRLVHALLACAEAVQQENLQVAESLVKHVGVLAMSQGGAMRKVATYFAEALARRIYRIYPHHDATLDAAFSDMLQMHFYEACPYLKFAHFTANQALLEAFAGKSRVHIVDFSMKQGLQWPPLMQALALRPGGAPSFRLTGIGPPQPDSSDALQQVGLKLAQFAETLHVEFEYRGFVASSLADLEPYMFDMGRRSSSSPSTSSSSSSSSTEEESVAVNSVFELHGLLGQVGSIEKVLATMKALKPSIVTMVEQEANHNGPIFLDRFTEALHYYSSMFDSLEGGGSAGGVIDSQDQVMTEVYFGRQICNVVSCEGPERTERHETLAQWRRRMADVGFVPVPLGSNAFKQASMLLELFAGGEGYRVEEKEGCLMLGWHTRPLITTSAWRVASTQPSIAASGSQRHRP